MDEIKRQVAIARRRLAIGRFLRAFGWSVFAGLLLTVIGLAIPKIWHLSFLATPDHHDAWTMSWLVAGGVLGLLVAAVQVWRGRESSLAAATEIDRRFGLKERLSSALSMAEDDRSAAAGQALVADASQAAAGIDVRDRFEFPASWRLALPLIPLLMLVGLSFLPNATQTAQAQPNKQDERKKVEVAIEDAKKKLAEKKKQMSAKGLDEAKLDLSSLERKFDRLLEDKSSTKKDALVELNDIKKEIADRQQSLGSSKELKQSLNRLKSVGTGAAKKITDAMAKGDMKEAQKAIRDLADKLKSGKLSNAERKRLAKDLDDIAKQLKDIAQKHEEEKEKLKQQVQQALDQGDLDKAAKLQEKLEQKQAQDQQKKKMQKMANNLQKCANCMKQGGAKAGKQGQAKQDGKQPGQNSDQQGKAQMKEAGEALDELAKQIEQMDGELQDMENLEDLERIADEAQQNMNMDFDPDNPPQWQDWAKGGGRGAGKRDKEEDKIGTFKSRVKAKLQKGQTVVTGSADGNNISGRSVSEATELIRAEMSKESDPLENQQLPRAQRDHARQYFEALREVE